MHGQPVNDDAIDFFEIDQGITLRHMVLRNSDPMGTVLFLHGVQRDGVLKVAITT